MKIRYFLQKEQLDLTMAWTISQQSEKDRCCIQVLKNIFHKIFHVICPQDSLPHNICLFQPCLLGILPEQGGIDGVSPPKRPSPKTSIQDHILPLCNQVSEAKFSHKQDSKLKLSIRLELWQNYRINFWLDPKQRESTVGNENTLNMAPKDPM